MHNKYVAINDNHDLLYLINWIYFQQPCIVTLEPEHAPQFFTIDKDLAIFVGDKVMTVDLSKIYDRKFH